MSKLLFLMAGAGSGKTSYLVKTLSQKISENNLKPEEVLISTFTRAAAAEIRDRALAKIAEDGCSPEAVMALRSASISTIHGLGLSYIRRYWYHFGISPEPEVLDEASGDRFIRNMLKTKNISIELEKRLNELNRLFAFQERGGNKYDPNAWRNQLAEILNKAVQNGIKNLGPGSKSHQKSLDWLKTIYPNVPNHNGNNQEGTALNLIPEELKAAAIQELRALPDHPGRNTASVKAATNRIETIENFQPKCFKDYLNLFNKKFDGGEGLFIPSIELNRGILPRTLEYIEILRDVTENPVFYQHCHEYTEILMGLAHECLSDYVNYKKENNLIDYNDMESYFLELLQNELFRAEIQEEIGKTVKLVMVDEFQDCNEIQISIFSELLQIVNENIWVGDSKQAIYGFRGTDSSVIDDIIGKIRLGRAQFAGHDVRFGMLKSSFRSVPELVQLSNDVFGRLLQNQQQPVRIGRDLITGFNDHGGLDKWKDDVFGNQEEATLDAEHLIGLLPVKSAVPGPVPLVRYIKQGIPKITETLVSAVAHILNPENNFKVLEDGELRPLRPADIAILCRSNSQVDSYAENLLAAGFPVAYSTSDFYSSAEFRLMQSLFLFLQDPSDNLAATEISLLTRQTTYEEAGRFILNRQTNAQTLQDEIPFFTQLAEIAGNKRFWGVKNLAEKLIAELNLVRHVSAFPDPQQRRNNLMQFVKMAADFELRSRNESKSALLVDFLSWIESERNSFAIAPSSGTDAVQVLSIHKSKGLEWPVVIPVGNKGMFEKLTNLDKVFEIRIDGKASSIYDQSDAEQEEMHVVMGFFPFGGVEKYAGNPHDNLSPDLKARLTSKEWDEHHRLMYVAATRARNYLVDLNAEDGGNKNFFGFHSMLEAEGKLNFNDIINENTFSSVLLGDYQSVERTANIENNRLPDFIRGNQQPKLPYFYQPSRAENPPDNQNCHVQVIHKIGHRLEMKQVQNRFENLFAGREDELLGNLLHAIFYLHDISKLTTKGVDGMSASSFSISEEQLELLKKTHNDFFTWCHKLAGENCRIHRELPLEYMENGQVWTGTADLVLEGKNGVFLIDYKSYQGGESDITVKGEHSAHRYYAQLSAYRKMLKSNMEDPSAFRDMMIFYPMSGLVVKLSDQ
jgi:ATP-dependent helicase/nuclease subunit A